MIEISDQIKQLLEGKYVALATVGNNNDPNVVAVEVNRVIKSNQILITDNFFNKTKKNLLNNTNVSIACWSKKPLAGFQLKGRAEYFTKGKCSDLVTRLNPGLPHKGYIIITISEIWDLANPHLICQQ